MFNVQEAIPGFRPTASYYRYAWGRSPDPQQACDGVLYHNGAKNRFESVQSRLTERVDLNNVNERGWNRVELHITRDKIEVSRNGRLMGHIYKSTNASSLHLTYGEFGLYCGGHGGNGHACAFDNVLVVDALNATRAIVKPSPDAVAPEERPAASQTLYSLGPVGF